MFFFLIDIDECALESACDAKTEKCENTAGSYDCLCKSGYKMEHGKCIKDKGNKKPRKKKKSKNEKSDDIFELLNQGMVLSEAHLKIGTFLYACFFAALYFLFQRRSWYGISFLILFFVLLVISLNRKYNQ